MILSDTGRIAIVKISMDASGRRRHLELVWQNHGHVEFRMRQGGARKPEDFGEFESVLYLTPFEAAM